MEDKDQTLEPRLTRRQFLKKVTQAATATLVATQAPWLLQPNPVQAQPPELSPLPDPTPFSLWRPLEEHPSQNDISEHLRTLREHPFINPPIYQEASPGEVLDDLVRGRVVPLPDKVIAQLNFLLNENSREWNSPELNKLICRAGDLAILVDESEYGRDNINLIVYQRLTGHLEDIISKRITPLHPDLIRSIGDSIELYLSLYEPAKIEIATRYKDIIDKLNSLVAEKRIEANDPLLTYLSKVDKFYDSRGAMAQTLVAEKIVDLIEESSGNELSILGLLKKTNPDSLTNFLPRIIGLSVHSSCWSSVNWAKLSRDIQLGEFPGVFNYLQKKYLLWQEYLNPEPLREITPHKEGGIEIFGEDKPCDLEDLQSIFLKSAGKLFTNGVPSQAEIAVYRRGLLDPSKRRVEFIISEKAWEAIRGYVPEGVNWVDWFRLHLDKLNGMLLFANPPVDIEVDMARIIIVEEGLIEKQQEKYGNIFGKPVGILNTEEGSLLFQRDYLSPWSLDVQGRWVYPFPPLAHTGYKMKAQSSSHEMVTLDSGMIHEIAHQILLMGDTYVYNSFDSPADKLSKVARATSYGTTLKVPEALLRLRLEGGFGGTLLPAFTGKGEFLDYSWTETLQLLYLQQKFPEYAKTQYRPFMKSSQDRSTYEFLEGRDFKIIDGSDHLHRLASLRVIPFSEQEIVRTEGNFENGEVVLRPRQLQDTIFNPRNPANTLLLQLGTPTGELFFLPVPLNLITAGFCAASLEDKTESSLKLELFQPPVKGNNYANIARLNLYLTPGDEYSRALRGIKGLLYASMKLQFAGKSYYALWEMVPK